MRDSTRSLNRLSSYDKKQINLLIDRVNLLCDRLQNIEDWCSINNYNESVNLKSFEDKNTEYLVIKSWAELRKLSEDLDYIFLEF